MRGTDQTTLHFDAIVAQYYQALCYFAERTTGQRTVAEEIVQDVFVKFWERLSGFDHDMAVKKFLYRSVRNAALNYLRDTRIKLRHESAYAQAAEVTEADISRSIIAAEVWRDINLAIHNLPEQCCRVIRMSFEEGLSAAEIAQALGVTESTVRNQKARGISLLRKMLSARAMEVLLLFL